MAKHVPTIQKIIPNAWRKIHQSGLNFKPRGRANIMWDEITQNAKNEWAASKDIKIVTGPQTTHYWIDDRVVFRFKKCDRNGYTSNIPTQNVLDFHNPEIEFSQKIIRLEVGYVLNQDETEIQDILVIHRYNNTVNFAFSILSSGHGSAAVILPNQWVPPQTTGNVQVNVKLKQDKPSNSSAQNDE